MVSCKIDLFKYGLNNNKINIGAKLELKPKGPEFKGERNKIAQSSIPNLKKYLNMLIIVLLYAPKRIENGRKKVFIPPVYIRCVKSWEELASNIPLIKIMILHKKKSLIICLQSKLLKPFFV